MNARNFMLAVSIVGCASTVADATTDCPVVLESTSVANSDPSVQPLFCGAPCAVCPLPGGLTFRGPFTLHTPGNLMDGETGQLVIQPNAALIETLPTGPCSGIDQLVGVYIVWKWPVMLPGCDLAVDIDATFSLLGDQVTFDFQGMVEYPRCVMFNSTGIPFTRDTCGAFLLPDTCAPKPGAPLTDAYGWFVRLPRMGRHNSPWWPLVEKLNAGELVVGVPELTVTPSLPDLAVALTSNLVSQLYLVTEVNPRWGDLMLVSPKEGSTEIGDGERGIVYSNSNDDSGAAGVVDSLEMTDKFRRPGAIPDALVNDVMMVTDPDLIGDFPYIDHVDPQLMAVVIDMGCDLSSFSAVRVSATGAGEQPARFWLGNNFDGPDTIYESIVPRQNPVEFQFPMELGLFCALVGQPDVESGCTSGPGWGQPIGLFIEALAPVGDEITLTLEGKHNGFWQTLDAVKLEVNGVEFFIGDSTSGEFVLPTLQGAPIPPSGPEEAAQLLERLVPVTANISQSVLELRANPILGLWAPANMQWIVRRPGAAGTPEDPEFMRVSDLAAAPPGDSEGEPWPGFDPVSPGYFTMHVVPGMDPQAWYGADGILSNLFIAHHPEESFPGAGGLAGQPGGFSNVTILAGMCGPASMSSSTTATGSCSGTADPCCNEGASPGMICVDGEWMLDDPCGAGGGGGAGGGNGGGGGFEGGDDDLGPPGDKCPPKDCEPGCKPDAACEDEGCDQSLPPLSFPAPKADDHHFVVELAASACSFGPIVIDIPVERYAGSTNEQDDTLYYLNQLLSLGLISTHATLTICAFDVDTDSCPGAEFAPEEHAVKFNGVPVKALNPNNPPILRGDGDGVWTNPVWNMFKIPMSAVKFPSRRGADGNKPTPALNRVEIEVDSANGGGTWGVSVAWVELCFEIMSPVVLVHGTNSTPAFWVHHGFMLGLSEAGLLRDNSIAMPTSTRQTNGQNIYLQLHSIVRSFGVDSIHVVAHSKGGLDFREYLEHHYPKDRDTFRVLSLTTLSTPHQGSALADIAVAQHNGSLSLLQNVELEGVETGLALLIDAASAYEKIMGESLLYGPDKPALSTTGCAAFNATNIPRLPRDITYNTVGADMDDNASGHIDALAEIDGMIKDAKDLRWVFLQSQTAALELIDTLYQGLLKTSFVTVRSTFKVVVVYVEGVPIPVPMPVYEITAVSTGTFPNDSLVTTTSSLGDNAYQSLRLATQGRWKLYFGTPAGRNHANVADGGVASDVAPWLVAAEKQRGDLRPSGSPAARAQRAARLGGDPLPEVGGVSVAPIQAAVVGLPRGEVEASHAFVVDDASTIVVTLAAAGGDVVISIETPEGEVVDASSVDELGGEYSLHEPPHSLAVHLLAMPSQGAGEYVLHVQRTSDPTADIVVSAKIGLPGASVSAGLIVSSDVGALGRPVSVSAFAVDGDRLLPLDAVELAIVTPTQHRIELVLLDDGQGTDAAAGDGIASGVFVPAEEGRHALHAEIVGLTANGLAFVRTVGQGFMAVQASGSLTGHINDRVEDDDGDGLFERLVVDVGMACSTPGAYSCTVELECNGRTLFARGERSLTAGGVIPAALPATDVVAAGGDGPYLVKSIQLHFNHPQAGAVLVDAKVVELSTAPYLLADFERPFIELTGDDSIELVDLDNDGDIDALTIHVGVRAARQGEHLLGASLYDTCLGRIQTVTGAQNLVGGMIEESLNLTFEGSIIGANGIDGPFSVGELVVSDQTAGWYASPDIQTPPLAARIFAGYQPAADCNTNGVADRCEVTFGIVSDANDNGIPDECECPGDLDASQTVDGADLGVLLGGWGTGNAPGDLNDDGAVDGADLGILLGYWGGGC